MTQISRHIFVEMTPSKKHRTFLSKLTPYGRCFLLGVVIAVAIVFWGLNLDLLN